MINVELKVKDFALRIKIETGLYDFFFYDVHLIYNFLNN